MFTVWIERFCPFNIPKGKHYDDQSMAPALNYSLVTCNSYLVVVGVGHIEQALFRRPGHTERMLQLGVHSFAV